MDERNRRAYKSRIEFLTTTVSRNVLSVFLMVNWRKKTRATSETPCKTVKSTIK